MMYGKTRRLLWLAPLLGAVAAVAALAVLVAPARPAQAHDLPGAVMNLTAMADGVSQIDLSWDAPDSGGMPTGYRIDRSMDGNVWMSLTTGVTGTAYSDTGLRRGTSYYYRVFAMNAAGVGPVSQDYLTMTTSGTAPSRVINLRATAQGQNQINLVWEAPADDGGVPITDYHIHYAMGRAEPPGQSVRPGQAGVILHPAEDGTSYEHTGLTAGTRYQYYVYAVNAAGKAERRSNSAGADTAPLSQPSKVRGLTVVPSRATPDTYNIYWYPPSDLGGAAAVTLYSVQAAYNGTDNFGPSGFTLSNDGTVTEQASGTVPANTGGVANTHVQFRVRATVVQAPVGQLNSEWVYSRVFEYEPVEELWDFLPERPAVNAPVRDPITGNVDLSWSPGVPVGNEPFPSSVSGYRIDVSDDGMNWEPLVADTSKTDTTYHYFDAVKKNRYYRIFARHAQYWGFANATPVLSGLGEVMITEPGHVRNFTATATGPTSITLNWDPPANNGGAPIVGYRIDGAFQRPDTGMFDAFPEFDDIEDSSPDNFDLLFRCCRDATTFVHDAESSNSNIPMAAGQTWRYRVIAITDDGTTVRWSEQITAEHRRATTHQADMPEAPEGLAAEDAKDSNLSGVADRGVLLLWNAPNPPDGATITGYSVQRMTNDGPWETIAGNTGRTNTDYTDTDEPAADELRAYRVAARSGSNVGMYTDPVYYPHALSMHNTPPMAGTAIADQTVTAGEMVMVPSTITDADMDDMLTWSVMSDMDAVATAMVDNMGMVTVTGVMAGMATITVTAMDGSGASAMQSFMVTVEAAELTAPTNVMATVVDDNPGAPDVMVTWTNGMGAAQHAVILFDEDFNFGDRIAGGQDDGMHTFQNVPSGTYTAVVVALDAEYEMELAFDVVTVP